jgi:hypothetical protein
VGETVLAGSACNHGFALPIITISEDARNTPRNERSEFGFVINGNWKCRCNTLIL